MINDYHIIHLIIIKRFHLIYKGYIKFSKTYFSLYPVCKIKLEI